MFNYFFCIKGFNKNEISVALKSSEPESLPMTLDDLQTYILHSKNYFKFQYHNGLLLYISCGKNLNRDSKIYVSLQNPPTTNDCSLIATRHFINLHRVIEIQFPEEKGPNMNTIKQSLNAVKQSPIDVMLEDKNKVYVVNDGTGKIYFTIFNDCNVDSPHSPQYMLHFKYKLESSHWRITSNIPSNAYPGCIAEMIKSNFVPDAQWLIDTVKSGVKFTPYVPTDEIDIEKIKQSLPQGWTLTQYSDHIIIKQTCFH